jgi:hypothetical protein
MDIAAIDHLLTTTRSVRRRLDLTRPLEPEILERLQRRSRANRLRSTRGRNIYEEPDAESRHFLLKNAIRPTCALSIRARGRV